MQLSLIFSTGPEHDEEGRECLPEYKGEALAGKLGSSPELWKNRRYRVAGREREIAASDRYQKLNRYRSLPGENKAEEVPGHRMYAGEEEEESPTRE